MKRRACLLGGSLVSLTVAEPMQLPTPRHSSSSPEPSAGDYLVLAQDADGAGARLLELAEVHWAYTDRFRTELIFRGPLLSDDGLRHAGSLHLLRAPSVGFAERFAHEEPYQRAGLFSQVQVLPFMAVLSPRPPEPDQPSAQGAFVLARWAPVPRPSDSATALRPSGPAAEPWLLLGLLLTPDGHCTGAAGVLAQSPATARNTLLAWRGAAGLPHGPIQAWRWRRGGRR